MNLFRSFSLLTLLPLFIAGCAPSKAFIDRSAEGQIIWPGPPETPRIKYLWSVNQLSGGSEGRRGLLDLLSGSFEGDVTDPRTSNVLMRPFGIFLDSRNKLYVTDPGAYRVTVIDLNTADVFHITEAGPEEFASPVGVIADPTGRIYISDSELRKVFVFDEKGKFLYPLEGDFKRPTCLAIDARNLRIYVSDTLDNKVYTYSTDGKRLGKIGHAGSLPGELNFPTHLFVNKEGLLFVTNAMNFNIQIFGGEGNFIGEIGIHGNTQSSLDKPKGVAVDNEGHIYVVDSIEDTVKIFDREGRLLLSFGEKGTDYGKFWLPSGIFIDSKDIIYVADTYNMRVQAFQFLGESGKK